MMLDTDILIDLLRGRSEAVSFFRTLPDPPLVSAISLPELYAGVRDGRERTDLDQLAARVEVVPIDQVTATGGGLLKRQYAKSHGVSLNDALIAASALDRGVSLATLNAKHFPMLTPVVPYRKP